MMERVQAAIARHRLILSGDHIVAAVSGGADSIALTRVLAALRAPLGFTLSLVHVHHGIRGAAADADEAWVRDAAASGDLPLDVVHADVPAEASAAGLSLEMAAREARLRAFHSVLAARCAAAIATGHTLDDRVETFFLRLLRGGGGAGLSGMRTASTVRDLRLIRPLLACRRNDVEAYLRSLGQAWRNDASNQDDCFTRNRVRNELLPMLREHFNPSVDDAIFRTAELLEQDETFLETLAQQALLRCRTADGLDVERIRSEPPALCNRLIRRWLMDEGVAGERLNRALFDRVQALMASTAGSSSIPLPGGGTVARAYQTLSACIDENPPPDAFAYSLDVPGLVRLPVCGLQAHATLVAASQPRRDGSLAHWPAEACLRWTRDVTGPFTLRSRRPGDQMRPLDLGGTVKLKDVLINAKIPRTLRDQIPVCEYQGEIVWVPGYRVAEGWDVRKNDKECAKIRIEACPG